MEHRKNLSDVLHISTAESNDGELAAMVSFAIAFPNGFMALVDTYDVKRYIICFFCFQNNLSDQYCYQNNFQWKIFKNSFISFGKFSIKKLFFFHSFDTKYGLKIHSNPKKLGILWNVDSLYKNHIIIDMKEKMESYLI